MDEKMTNLKPEEIGATNSVIDAIEHETDDPKDAEVE